MFQTVSLELLPTPSKSHYTFNLRDLANVVQGVLNTSPSECASETDIFRLWTHEVRRVFQDRLTDEIDRATFEKMHGEVVQKHFKKSMSSIIGNGADGKGMLLYTAISSIRIASTSNESTVRSKKFLEPWHSLKSTCKNMTL